MTPDQLQALARKTADKLFDSLGLVNSASKSEAIILAALEEAVKEITCQFKTMHKAMDQLHAANDTVTRERAALRTQADALATALDTIQDTVTEFASSGIKLERIRDMARAALAAYRKEKQL